MDVKEWKFSGIQGIRTRQSAQIASFNNRHCHKSATLLEGTH